MKAPIQRVTRTVLLAIAILAVCSCWADEIDQIVFLHLRLKDGVVTLVRSSVRPGRLKMPFASDRKGEIHLELTATDGSSLWSEVMADPTVQRLEYEDQERPGTLKIKVVKVTEAEFTVRVPFHKDARQLKLQRLDKPANRAEARTPGTTQKLLGTVAIATSTNIELAGGALLVSAPRALSQGAIAQVLTNGPTDKRINIVFLSEGYRQSQTNQFAADARKLLNDILRTPPFNAYSNYFNAFTIFVASTEAGSDHPARGFFVNTYFNSSYDSYGVGSLITIPPNELDQAYANGAGKVDALLQSLMPEYDVSVLIVNDTAYGSSGVTARSGYPPLIASVNSGASEMAVHELGHNYSALGDEYDDAYPGYPDTEQPNTTRETRRTWIKWRDWILASTPIPTPQTSAYAAVVGLFEGAHYHPTGWYRPKLNCKMNHLGVPFCEVCSEALVKSTYGLVRPIDSNSPPTNAVITLVDTQAMMLMITRPQPDGYNLNAQWFTNNVAVPAATNGTFTIAASALPPGTNQVRVEVTDPTAKVRLDPMQVLKDSRTWQINAQVRPMLEARRSQNRIILSWPASATGFVLECKTNFSLATSWALVGGSPVVVSNRFTVTNLTTGDAQYFRLRQ